MIKQLFTCLLASLLVITSCETNTDDTPTPEIPTPEQTCQLTQRQTTTQDPDGSITSYTSSMEYDTQKKLTGFTTLYSDGRILKNFYRYNSEGFLTEEETTIEPREGFYWVTQYEYTQDKLTKIKDTYKSSGLENDYEDTYNTDGWLISSIQNITDTNAGEKFFSKKNILHQYTNGKLTSIVEEEVTNTGSSSVTYSIETDAKGLLLSKLAANSDKTVYQYNADGEQIRSEHYFNGKMDSYTVAEYDNKARIETIISPSFKGHSTKSIYGLKKHNKTKEVQYTIKPDNTTDEKLRTTYEYEYDPNGNPLKRIQKVTSFGKTTTTTTTYTITCP
ncbi:hypothetical protein QNI19_29540 [Cytophagaceae bacterium DM2B3-1]|uniref:Sugar-binding protein n=1 Tax=Xanthocytophaga flava TaxID=3048013 RepID=A0ABT7CTL5_9BACT|nr:hypothetical protein [Xanthocytophaga flavus]MDJ1497118.1 hypothetical protein [Xanthocytophaga flavus]